MDRIGNQQQRLEHLRSLSALLDTKYEGPLGFRFGIDGLLGLVPVVGDMITSGMSLYIIAQAATMGVGASTLIRMAINVGIENLFDMIPVIGNLFDFYWKSNAKNLILIEKHLANPARETIRSRMVIALVCCILVFLLLISSIVTFLILRGLFDWILTLSKS